MNSMRTLRANQIYMNMHKDALADMKAARVILRTALETLAVVAGGEYKTLKAKKAAINAVLESEVVSKSDAVGKALQHMGLVSTGANALRNAMMGFSCCALAATFDEFYEQQAYTMQRGVTAMSFINNMINRCTAHAEFFRSCVQKEARARLPAVAKPKYIRKLRAGVYKAAWYVEPPFRITFKQWNQALVIRSISKNWFVGSI